ncbi:MAG: riboflavin synthase [Candidatus Midichloriaceae bacterium]|jgi:riboflavin synthase
MFTGIIRDIGQVTEIRKKASDYRVKIKTNLNLSLVELGDSIACDGICLSVEEITKNEIVVYVSPETLSKTNIRYWKEMYNVNLETSLRVGDKLNGHFVQGHVDGCIKFIDSEKIGDSTIMTFEMPEEFKKFIVYKGAITINGISLTVNDVYSKNFCVNIIPITLQNTNLQYLEDEDFINFEIDLLARYVNKHV